MRPWGRPAGSTIPFASPASGGGPRWSGPSMRCLLHPDQARSFGREVVPDLGGMCRRRGPWRVPPATGRPYHQPIGRL